MLKKEERLQTKEDFERVFRRGKPLFFGAVGCKIARNDLGYIRLGFSLSKKHLATAVERNRLRRVLAAAFSVALPEAKRQVGADIVFFTVKNPGSKDFKPFALAAQSVVEYLSQ